MPMDNDFFTKCIMNSSILGSCPACKLIFSEYTKVMSQLDTPAMGIPFENSNSVLYAIHQDYGPIAAIVFVVNSDLSTLNVIFACTAEEYRRKSIFSTMFKYLQQYAVEQRIKNIVVCMPAQDAEGQAMIEKLGLKRFGVWYAKELDLPKPQFPQTPPQNGFLN